MAVTKEKEELRVCQITLAIILIISFFYIYWSVYEYDNLRTEYYNYRAKVECPMMQYENISYEPKIIKKVNLECPSLCMHNWFPYYNSVEECARDCYKRTEYNSTVFVQIKSYKNFTTGRYIDGKIECLGEEWSGCKKLREEGQQIENPLKCYQKSQNFTLEEFGIR